MAIIEKRVCDFCLQDGQERKAVAYYYPPDLCNERWDLCQSCARDVKAAGIKICPIDGTRN